MVHNLFSINMNNSNKDEKLEEMPSDGNILFCAVDPSISSTGISILTVDDLDNRKFRIIDKGVVKPGHKLKGFEKKIEVFELFRIWVERWIDRLSFFVIEAYSYGSVGKLADLGEFGGILKKYIYDSGKPFDTIEPKSVKKIITGNGNAKKDEVARCVKNFLVDPNVEFSTYDESDSVAIGIAYAIKMAEIQESLDNEFEED